MNPTAAETLEHLALDAGKGEQRHINENDDRLAKYGWLDHLLSRSDDRAETLGLGEPPPKGTLALGQMPESILCDDDGATDDEAKIERAETHQIGADSPRPFPSRSTASLDPLGLDLPGRHINRVRPSGPAVLGCRGRCGGTVRNPGKLGSCEMPRSQARRQRPDKPQLRISGPFQASRPGL